MKIKVYTAITDNKDRGRNDIEIFNKYNKFQQPVMNAKIYKVLPHLFFETEYSIWVDGHVFLDFNPEVFIDMLDDKEIGVFKHPSRNNIYDEANRCKELRLDNIETIDKQMKRYKKENFDGENLAACYIIVRKHTEEIKTLNEKWWAEICRGSVRDQLSFPYVFKNKVKYFPSQTKYFSMHGHKK